MHIGLTLMNILILGFLWPSASLSLSLSVILSPSIYQSALSSNKAYRVTRSHWEKRKELRAHINLPAENEGERVIKCRKYVWSLSNTTYFWLHRRVLRFHANGINGNACRNRPQRERWTVGSKTGVVLALAAPWLVPIRGQKGVVGHRSRFKNACFEFGMGEKTLICAKEKKKKKANWFVLNTYY